MTNASSFTETTVRHHFVVPNKSVYADLDVALHWARQKAAELKIDTDFDDWCEIVSDENQMAFVVTEVKKARTKSRDEADAKVRRDEIVRHQDLLATLYTLTTWNSLASHLPVEQQTLMADSIDASRMRAAQTGGPEFSAVERWWEPRRIPTDPTT